MFNRLQISIGFYFVVDKQNSRQALPRQHSIGQILVEFPFLLINFDHAIQSTHKHFGHQYPDFWIIMAHLKSVSIEFTEQSCFNDEGVHVPAADC